MLKSETNPNYKNFNVQNLEAFFHNKRHLNVLNFEHLTLDIVSRFVLLISNFFKGK